ncbi:MAG: hypothetical protein R2733_19115 [Acidimicrobiales bacterium]
MRAMWVRSDKWPRLGTSYRPESVDPWTQPLLRSYVGLRLLIGVLGVMLPITLVLTDWLFLDDQREIRGSMSAYYHSGARDLFVGGLTTAAIVLIGYQFWNWWSWDFLLSFVAGAAIVVVAFVPTARPNPGGHPLDCDRVVPPGVPMCASLQAEFGEASSRTIHVVAAAVVVVSFCALCVVFALRQFGYGAAARAVMRYRPADDAPPLGVPAVWRALSAEGVGIIAHLWRRVPKAVLFSFCAIGVLAGGAWAMIGVPLWWPGAGDLPPTYVGEFAAFTSYGAAWIVASWDLLKQAGPLRSAVEAVGHAVGVDGGQEGATTVP